MDTRYLSVPSEIIVIDQDAQTSATLWMPLPDGMSSNSTLTTITSDSDGVTIPGIGMTSGRVIKRLGKRTIEFTENARIRFRLSAIKNSIRTKPSSYWELPSKEVQDIIEDLYEFLHDDYPEGTREEAGFLKQQLVDRNIVEDFMIRRRLQEIKNDISMISEGNWSESGQAVRVRTAVEALQDLLRDEYPQAVTHRAMFLKQELERLVIESSFAEYFRPEEAYYQSNNPDLEGSLAEMELIETERRYIKDLEIIQKVADKLSHNGMIDTAERVLGNVKQLLDFHQTFLAKLELALLSHRQQWDQLFLDSEKELVSLYEAYSLTQTILSLANDQNFSLSINATCLACLHKPIERVHEYSELLDSLSNTSCKVATRISAQIMKVQRLVDNTIDDFMTRVVDWKSHDTTNFGQFLLDDVILATSYGWKQWQHYHIFLFQQVLVICQKSSISSNERNSHDDFKLLLKKHDTAHLDMRDIIPVDSLRYLGNISTTDSLLRSCILISLISCL